MIDQHLLLAALRHGDLDPAPGMGGERLLHQRPLLDLMRQQDQARHRLVVIELGEEGGEDLARLRAILSARGK